ncbi:tetratricopeptide (TPR) repeat protein [Thermonema lapsum]|uniref:Tetratricopeptide (TPR) repeat protein n=1 Tax=Thermonema lapsum TaxID=28195 RepID=A0A846MTE1_9BACT|nr:tetratricopeptide repeat protein [Thermonema lapsum]NIK74856.1 tetratricopeptide (TPR) repeat protein [Thermonema lapsum]
MHDERIRKLEEMLQVSPDDPFLYYALAMEYYEAMPEKALQYLEHLQQNFPDYAPTYYPLAHLHWNMGQPARARAAFEQGIEICRRVGENKLLTELQTAFRSFLLEEE